MRDVDSCLAHPLPPFPMYLGSMVDMVLARRHRAERKYHYDIRIHTISYGIYTPVYYSISDADSHVFGTPALQGKWVRVRLLFESKR